MIMRQGFMWVLFARIFTNYTHETALSFLHCCLLAAWACPPGFWARVNLTAPHTHSRPLAGWRSHRIQHGEVQGSVHAARAIKVAGGQAVVGQPNAAMCRLRQGPLGCQGLSQVQLPSPG